MRGSTEIGGGGFHRLREAAHADPSAFMGDVTLADISETAGSVKGAYLIRLFAEFETGLRLYWAAKRKTPPPSRTRDLLEGVAAMREIRVEILANAQGVREHRNALVHEREGATVPLSIGAARRHLCRYFSFLPPA